MLEAPEGQRLDVVDPPRLGLYPLQMPMEALDVRRAAEKDDGVVETPLLEPAVEALVSTRDLDPHLEQWGA